MMIEIDQSLINRLKFKCLNQSYPCMIGRLSAFSSKLATSTPSIDTDGGKLLLKMRDLTTFTNKVS